MKAQLDPNYPKATIFLLRKKNCFKYFIPFYSMHWNKKYGSIFAIISKNYEGHIVPMRHANRKHKKKPFSSRSEFTRNIISSKSHHKKYLRCIKIQYFVYLFLFLCFKLKNREKFPSFQFQVQNLIKIIILIQCYANTGKIN